ncbi:MAG: prepilin-type N-terminal cleavage/methylation domain-containing protein [Alphaproteobacteria bacterium]
MYSFRHRGRCGRYGGSRRGLTLLEVIFALAIAAVGLSVWVGLEGQRSLEKEARYYGEILRAHAITGANLASSDLPLIGRSNQPGGNPFIIRNNPYPSSLTEITSGPNLGSRGFELFGGTGGSVVDTAGYLPLTLTAALLECMFADYDGYTASDVLRGGLLGANDAGEEVIFNSPASAWGVSSTTQITGFADFYDHVAHGRPVGDSPESGLRSTGGRIPGLNVWRFLSANCLYFTAIDGASNIDAPAKFVEDRLKVAVSTGDIADPGTAGEVEANSSFRCVDSGYQDAQGRILPPGNDARPDAIGNLLTDYGAATGRTHISGQEIATYVASLTSSPSRAKFLSIDPDTCFGARLLSDAAGGVHWKSNIGLRDDGSEAQPEFFIGFDNAESVYEAAYRLEENNDVQALVEELLSNPSFRLRVFVLFPGHSFGGGVYGRARSDAIARAAGPAAMLIGAGSQQGVTNSSEIRASNPVAFYPLNSVEPAGDFYFPWTVPAGTQPGASAALSLREGSVALVSSRALGAPLQDWLNSVARSTRAPTEPTAAFTPDVSLATSLYHHTEDFNRSEALQNSYYVGGGFPCFSCNILRGAPGGAIRQLTVSSPVENIAHYIFRNPSPSPAQISPLRDENGDELGNAITIFMGGFSTSPMNIYTFTGAQTALSRAFYGSTTGLPLPNGYIDTTPVNYGVGRNVPNNVASIFNSAYLGGTSSILGLVGKLPPRRNSQAENSRALSGYAVFDQWSPADINWPYLHQLYGQLNTDEADDGTPDVIASDVNMWPRLLDVGKKSDPVQSITVNGDVDVTQLRIGENAQISVGGELIAGVECTLGYNVLLQTPTTEDALVNGVTASATTPAESNALIYPKNPVGDSLELIRYSPRCGGELEDVRWQRGGTDRTQFETEQFLDLPVRGLTIGDTVVGTTRSATILTNRLDARGTTVALPVSAGDQGSTVFRYECLQVARSNPGRSFTSLPSDC